MNRKHFLRSALLGVGLALLPEVLRPTVPEVVAEEDKQYIHLLMLRNGKIGYAIEADYYAKNKDYIDKYILYNYK